MRNILFFITTFVFIAFAPLLATALSVPAGVPDRSLWFSKDPFFEGESITIYTLLYNSSPYQFSGTLTLYDGTTTLGSKLFTLSGGGASSIISYPWKVTGGNHVFSAAVTAKEFTTNTHIEAGTSVLTPKTGEVKRFADLDTDGDGEGNLADTDDDGDGLTDLLEKKSRTNALVSDTDGDGIKDGADLHPLLQDAPIEKPKPTNIVPATIPKTITDELPPRVVDVAVPVIGAVESYRIDAASDGKRAIEKTLTELVGEVATSSADGSGWGVFREGALSKEIIRSPFGYAKLFFMLLSQAVLTHVFVFYTLIFLIFCLIIRFIWGLFF